METVFGFIAMYLMIGMGMVYLSPSRGFRADLLFVFTWGAHLIQYMRGRD